MVSYYYFISNRVKERRDVLILIVVENGLVPSVALITLWCDVVLILIVVDNGLVLINLVCVDSFPKRLNPYCSGQWSRTVNEGTNDLADDVLILIVVDNGLVRHCGRRRLYCQQVLILIVVDNGLVHCKTLQ